MGKTRRNSNVSVFTEKPTKSMAELHAFADSQANAFKRMFAEKR